MPEPTKLSTSVPSDAQAILTAAEQFARAEVRHEGDAHYAILPHGKQLVSLKPILDAFRARPERRSGTSVHTDVESFLAHVARFGTADAVLFADPNPAGPSVTAIYDYTPAGPKLEEAGWMQHRAIFKPVLSEEWLAWCAINGRAMPQDTFAETIENRILDVAVADPAESASLQAFVDAIGGAKLATPGELVALSRGLSVNVETKVRDAVTLASGEISVVYEEVHKDGAGQPIKVPNVFVIRIPVFRSGPLYQIPVRLRYRLNGGRITWSCHLHRADLAFKDAFEEATEQIAQESDRPLYIGAPER